MWARPACLFCSIVKRRFCPDAALAACRDARGSLQTCLLADPGDWCCLTAHHRTNLEKLVLRAHPTTAGAVVSKDGFERADDIRERLRMGIGNENDQASKGHSVDALACTGDEGRDTLR